jgi:DNA polymerase III epsilon subunit family exonuclease
MLLNAGFGPVSLGAVAPSGAMALDAGAVPATRLALHLFKALQLLVSRRYARPFLDFTAIDIETTDKSLGTAEVVELAAVRVRGGSMRDEFRTFVRPDTSIAPEATVVHGITNDDVRDAPPFAHVWPAFREFCRGDTLVAHNGCDFDFPILQRLSRACGGGRFRTFDTLLLAKEVHRGRHRLEDIALAYGIETGTKHRALDDARTLAQVCLRLDEKRLARARKTALVHLLDHLGVALALGDRESLDEEAQLLLNIARGHSLGRYSEALDHYQTARESSGDPTLPTLEQLIERLGGREALERVRAARTAEQRYPAAMSRLQRLLAHVTGETLADQIAGFLEHVALSARADGEGVQRGRVALLTLHATKGLEFSRVYVVGVEDAELPGYTASRPTTPAEVEEGRRLLYVGMTRAQDRLLLTRVGLRGGRPTGGHQFLTEMELAPERE